MKAYVFPGQGAQFLEMGKALYNEFPLAKELFEQANELLGFRISDIMFDGDADALKQTKVTQPAIFLHSVITSKIKADEFKPEIVAGHSLGEFSALCASGALSFEDGLLLVQKRALAMQKACETTQSTMAAILGLPDIEVENICNGIEEVVVPANYNCPGQLVISGSMEGIEIAVEQLKAAGAKRALILPVGGAFHSPLMEPARAELAEAINAVQFNPIQCPIYQNVDAKAHTEVSIIKQNLIQQLTAPVRWTQTIERMIEDGTTSFTEVGGTGKVLRGMIRKIDRTLPTETLS